MKLAIKERLAASGAASKLLSKLPGRGDKKPGKKRRWKKFAVAGVALVVAGVGWQLLSPSQSPLAASTTYSTAEVTRMDVSSSITGSGTLEAADSYSVTTLIEGSILTADFEEGDEVEEGTVLYTIDSSDSDASLEQAEISLSQSERSYQNTMETLAGLERPLITFGLEEGDVHAANLDVEVGDDVAAGETVATIRDSQTMSLEVSFPADDASSFYVGQSATVTLDSTFETLTGTISKISGTDTVLTGNVIVRTVTIDVSNPGGLSTEQTASAAVSGTFT